MKTSLNAELSSLLETNYGIYTADKCIDNNTAQTQLPYPWLALDLGRPRKLRRLSFSIEMVAVGMTSGIWRCVYLTPNLALMKGRFFAGGNLLGNFYGWGETGQEINVEQEMAIIGRYVVVQHNVRRFYTWSGVDVEWSGYNKDSNEQNNKAWAGCMDLAEVKVFGYE